MTTRPDEDRERAVAELRTSRAFLTSAFDQSPLMLSVADLATDRYLEVNEAFCACLGLKRDEVIGRSALELGLITAEGRDRLARELMAMLGASKRYPLEFELARRGGPPLLCRYWGQIIQSPQGTLLFAAGEDITEFRTQDQARAAALERQGEALRRSDERFALAMDAFSDGLWDWDCVSGTSYFSPGCYRMLGFPLGGLDASGLRWLDLVHPDERDALTRAIHECREGRRERFEGEYRLQSKAGEWLWVLARGRCVTRDAKGQCLRMLSTLVDVTERKRLQLGLAQNDRLASLGMLSAGVAHEISNPLAYVMSSLELIIDQLPKAPGGATATQEDLLELARNALEGCLRVKKIARGLTTFSRVEPVVLGPVDVNQAVEEAVRMAVAEVRYRAKLVRRLEPVPLARGAESKLAQVFLNLIVNAAHALDERKQATNEIRLRTWVEGSEVCAEVSDTGLGIAPEHLERVFEPFFTTKPAGVGSGLGLAISRRILAELGGDIRLESVVGQGTRVEVRLPVHAQPPPASPPPAAAPAEPTKRARVLLIDDEQLIRQALARQLSGHHDVVTASSSREAQALLERDEAFDVIVCDLMMPEVNGMEFFTWLAAAKPQLARRLIFISGGAFTPDAADFLARVSTPRLEKPFEVKRLLGLIAELR